MVQFGLVFFPSQITIVPTGGKALQEARHIDPTMRNLGDRAIEKEGDGYVDQRNFEVFSTDGALFCPPS
jgi:hypothetical protein